jgi:hypothetical protein
VTLGKGVVSVIRRRDSRFSLPSTDMHSAIPIKSIRQRSCCRCTVHRALRVFFRILGKALDSGSICAIKEASISHDILIILQDPHHEVQIRNTIYPSCFLEFSYLFNLTDRPTILSVWKAFARCI